MNLHAYAKQLILRRRETPGFAAYFGPRWIILKSIGILLGTYITLTQSPPLASFGTFLLGYSLGVVIADVRSWRLNMARWRMLDQVLDWPKVEALAADNPEGRSTTAR